MSDQNYRISVRNRDHVAFPSKRGMQKYLQTELEFWAPFLEHVRQNLPKGIRSRDAILTADTIASSLTRLIDQIENREKFNQAANFRGGLPPLPPPSDSLQGQLIRGLFDANYTEEALACFVYLKSIGVGIQYTNRDATHLLLEKGKALVEAAPIVAALPYNKVTTAKMAGAVRTAQNHVQALASQIEEAQTLQAQHGTDLAEHLETQKATAKRVNDVVLRLNKRRDRRQKRWVQATEELIATAFTDAEKKVRLFELNSQRAEKARAKEFKHLQELFMDQLRFRAPVELWAGREVKHTSNAESAMRWFVGFGAVAILFGLAVPLLAGDHIAASFYETFCKVQAVEGVPATATSAAVPASPPSGCERVFSAKGPVTVTGILLATSLLLWVTRLQYRIHLSERHLALDASEKKAFAETYQAMKEGKDVGADNEAIVLGSLFRPTQDGIIKDDGNGMDISAAALIAKQLGKPG